MMRARNDLLFKVSFYEECKDNLRVLKKWFLSDMTAGFIIHISVCDRLMKAITTEAVSGETASVKILFRI